MPKTKAPRKRTAPKAPKPSTNDENPENLDQVRDILFGGQMRAVESRLQRMEERLVREQDSMRADIQKQLGSLEQFAKKEIEALAGKIKDERGKRADADKTLDRRLAKLDEAMSAGDAELRSQLLEHGKAVADRMKDLSDTMSSELDRAVRQLQSEKADTASLVDVFSQVAVRLSEDLQEPEG